MPTEKFFNLKEGKRQAILEAAGEELLETPYSLLTVSQIIRRAGISRASFYYYFNDKEDLFQHMVEEMKTRFLKDMEKTLRECRGNFAEGFKKMVSSMLEDENLGKRCGLYRRLVEDAQCHMRAVRQEASFYDKDGLRQFVQSREGLLNEETYQGLGEEKTVSLLELGILVVIKTLFLQFAGSSAKKLLRETAFRQLEILDRGARSFRDSCMLSGRVTVQNGKSSCPVKTGQKAADIFPSL